MKYSLKIGAIKVIKYFLIFLVPVLVDIFIVRYPEVAQLSVGALLVGVVNFIKVKSTKIKQT